MATSSRKPVAIAPRRNAGIADERSQEKTGSVPVVVAEGWVAPHRRRRSWHYARHRGVSLCGNQAIDNEEKRHAKAPSERWDMICRRCALRLERSNKRRLWKHGRRL